MLPVQENKGLIILPEQNIQGTTLEETLTDKPLSLQIK